MEICRTAAAFSWGHSISPSLHFPQNFSTCESKGLRIYCPVNASASGQSQKEDQMTVSVTGATGFIGRRLVQRLLAAKDFQGIAIAEEPEWKDSIQGSNAVVNLAGMPISTRWSPEIKKKIKESRVRTISTDY